MSFFNSRIKQFFLDRDTQEKKCVLEEYASLDNDTSRSETQIRALVFNNSDIITAPQNIVIGKDVMRDIEMFDGYYKGETTIFSCVDSCETQGGKLVLKSILASPTRDVSKLKSRQSIIKDTESTSKETTWHHLKTLKRAETNMLWVFNAEDSDLAHLFDLVYFTTFLTKPLNNNGNVITFNALYKIVASPIIGIMTPLTYVIVPYLVLSYKFKIKLSFVSYVKSMWTMFIASNELFGGNPIMNNLKYVSYALSLLFYFQGLFNSFEIAKLTHSTSKIIYNNMKGFVEFIQAAYGLNKDLWRDEMVSAFDLTDDISTQVTHVFQTETAASKSTQAYFDGVRLPEFSMITNFGKTLSMFRRLRKQAFVPIILRAYIIDAIVTITRCKTNNAMTFPDYAAPSHGPVLKYLGVRHPCISPLKAVPNDIEFGASKKDDDAATRLALLTGPNAGGKSTMLKSVLSNIILAQTIGLACAASMTLTPFAFINSQINIPDCKGKESLFEAEMNRSHHNFEAVSSLADATSDFAFIAMDEVFNSTNPVEGIAGAYAILKKLATFPNALTMVTTHYLYLTKLAKELSESSPRLVRNYKMNVTHDTSTDAITFPYRMTPGISRQFIALKLLKQAGYDRDILDYAEDVKSRLMSTRV